MTEKQDIAGPVLAHLRRQEQEEGLVAWPGDLTEEEQVEYMRLIQERNGDDWLGIISFSPKHARDSIAAGRFVD